VVSKIELDASVRILAMWRAGTVLASLTDYAPDNGKPSESEREGERDGEREAEEKAKAAAALDAANLEAQSAIQTFLAQLMEDPTLAALEAEQQPQQEDGGRQELDRERVLLSSMLRSFRAAPPPFDFRLEHPSTPAPTPAAEVDVDDAAPPGLQPKSNQSAEKQQKQAELQKIAAVVEQRTKQRQQDTVRRVQRHVQALQADPEVLRLLQGLLRLAGPVLRAADADAEASAAATDANTAGAGTEGESVSLAAHRDLVSLFVAKICHGLAGSKAQAEALRNSCDGWGQHKGVCFDDLLLFVRTEMQTALR
jgi:hypothetical protein